MRPLWSGPGAYPGGDAQGQGYDHDAFRALYSDHHPVVFRLTAAGAAAGAEADHDAVDLLTVPAADDDG